MVQHPERSYEYALCKLQVSALPSIAPQEVLLKITRQNAASLQNLYINSPGGAFQQYGPASLYKPKTCKQVYYIVCLNDYDQPAFLPISPSFVVSFEGWLNEGLNVAQQPQLLFSKASRDGINVWISLLAGDISQYCTVFLISDPVFVRRSLRSEREATMPAGYKQYFGLPRFDWNELAFLTTPHPTISDTGQIESRKVEGFVEAYFKCLGDQTVHGGTLLPDHPRSAFAFLFERYAICVDADQGFRSLGFRIDGLDRYESSAGERSDLLFSLGDPRTLGITKSTWYPAYTIFYVDLPVHGGRDSSAATGFFCVLADGHYNYAFRVRCSFRKLGIDGYDFFNRWLSWKIQRHRLNIVVVYPSSTSAGTSKYVFKLKERSQDDIAGPLIVE